MYLEESCLFYGKGRIFTYLDIRIDLKSFINFVAWDSTFVI